MSKVRAYIDGFNLYHNIQEYIRLHQLSKKDFNWINTRKLVECFIGTNQNLDKVFLFSALPEHLKTQKQQRHKLFYSVQQNICNVKIIDGRFGKKGVKVICQHCQLDVYYTKYEEKETDVALGIQIVHDVNNVEELEKIIIVSGDTDFVPAIHYVLAYTNIKVKVLVPIKHRDFHLSGYLKKDNILKRHTEGKYKNYSVSPIKETHIKIARLPDELSFNNEIYINPYN